VSRALALLVGVGCAAPAPAAPSPAAPPRAPAPAAPAEAAAPAPQDARIDAIFADLTRARNPGCAVGVYRAGELVFARGYGYASLEHGTRIEPTTRFQVASVTKQFTAASILLLAGDGKLALGDDIRTYLPELPAYAAPITIDHLLHHTSGLRSGYALLALEGHDSLADWVTPDDALYLYAHQRGVDWPPGTRYDYMAGNYWLLAEIVRRVSGDKLAAFAQRRIFAPLGMTDTSMRDDHQAVIANAATGYARRGGDADGYDAPSINLEIVGGIGVVTTVRDLARWDANFFDPQVGGQAMVDGLRGLVRLNDGTVLAQARGLEIAEVAGSTRESYRGITDGFDAFVLRYPRERVGVAVLCNQTDLDAPGFAQRVAELYLPARPAEAAAASVGSAAPAAAPLSIDPWLAGVYVDRATAALRTFAIADGHLVMSGDVTGAGGRPLEQVSQTEFVAGGVAHYVFHAARDGKPAFVVRTLKDDPTSTMERQSPVGALTADALAAYAGRYASDEIPRDWEVAVEDGKLVGRPVGGRISHDAMVLLARDRFRRGDEQWTFERDARGRVTGFTYDAAPDALGLRYRRVLTR
jgi:CubicO group peptidase (beta-lactamase class C family)